MKQKRNYTQNIDSVGPADNDECDKKEIKVERNDRLSWEFKQLWSMKKFVLVPINVGALRKTL